MANISISLTDAQATFARSLVERGHYPSLSAVLRHGLELLRTQKDAEEAELEALRALIEKRRKGPFISVEEMRARTKTTIAEKNARDDI